MGIRLNKQKAGNESNQINVCMYAPIFYPEYSGGGTQALRLSKSLMQMGVKVIMLTENLSKSAEKEVLFGIPITRLKKHGHGIKNMVTLSVKMFNFLNKNRFDFDIIHVHGAFWYSLILILISKFLNKKIIVVMTASGYDDPLSIRDTHRFGRIRYKILGLADSIISIEKEMSDSYRKSGLPSDKLKEIYNGLDSNEFQPVSNEDKQKIKISLGLSSNIPFVVFTGMICKRKGTDLLLKAWAKVVKDHPNNKLILVGPEAKSETTFIKKLYEQVNENSLTDKIAFCGYVEADNIHLYLKVADIFAFPSRREGMPTAVLEAMSCGLPCVAMETSGVSSVITDKLSGLIFNSEDSDQLAQHISNLLRNPDYALQLGKEARKVILNKFSIENTANNYLSLYKQLLS